MGILPNGNACRGMLTLFVGALAIHWWHQPGVAQSQDIEQLREAAEQGDAETQFWTIHYVLGVRHHIY